MKIMRLGNSGSEQPAVLMPSEGGAGQYFSLLPLTRDVDGAFLAAGGLGKIREALDAGALPILQEAAGLRVGAPLARPGALVGIGMNYAAHAAESGSAPPEVPVVFLKPTSTVTGPYDPAPVPPHSNKYDWEVELGVVIGSEASYLKSLAEAQDCIAGYVTANDFSEREYQLPGAAGQWTKGKTLPGSTPLGPWLVPAADVDGGNLRLRSWVNGEARQDSTTSELIFDAPTLVHHCSQYMRLEPGDVILTGTPEGVALSGRFPYLQPGDIIEVEVGGLGRQRQELYRAGRGPAGQPAEQEQLRGKLRPS